MSKNNKPRRGSAKKRRAIALSVVSLALIALLLALFIPAYTQSNAVLLPAPLYENAASGARAAYALNLTYDEQAHTIGGKEIIEIRNATDEVWNELCVNDWPSAPAFASAPYGGATELSECAIIAGDKEYKVTPVRDAENSCRVYIPLAEGLKSAESMRLEWDILIHIPQGNDRFGFNEASCNLGGFIPQLALRRDGAWVSHPYCEYGESAASEIADFQLTLNAPEDLTVICTGESATRNGVTVAAASNVRDFCVVIGKDWHMVERKHGDTLVRSYYRGSFIMGHEALKAAVDALDAYGSSIGAYPYTTLDIVATDIWAAGLEYPQLIMMSEHYYDWSGDLLRGYFHNQFRIKLAHEVGHQWFYGLVGNDQYDEAWLDEAFATYLERIYADYVGIHHPTGYTELVLPLDSSLDVLSRDTYQNVAYTAGNAFLTDLRDIMGEEAFMSALRDIYMTYGYAVVNTNDVLSTFGKHTPATEAERAEALISEYFYLPR